MTQKDRKAGGNYVGLREEVQDEFTRNNKSAHSFMSDDNRRSISGSGTPSSNIKMNTITSANLNKLNVPGINASRFNLIRKSSSKSRAKVTESLSIPLNKMSLKLYGSKKAVQEEQERVKQAGSWIIHPYSNFRLLWDSLTLLLLVVNITLIPVAIAFWKVDHPTWLPFKCTTDVWFLVDILLNFRTGIVLDGPDSEVILEPKEIKSIYLRTWFVIDLVSTFPFDLLFTILNHVDQTRDSSVKALGLLRLAKILSLLRLLRLSRFIRYIRQWEEIFNFQYEIALAFARIFNQILLMFFICHFNGCLQYMVPMFLDFPPETWVSIRNLNSPNVTVWERYSWSLFKSTSHMLCIGYGQFPPQGLVDLWVTYVSMYSGAMCFALFIGNATTLIQSMDASKRAYKEKFVQVKDYMRFRKLPADLRRKLTDYYENRFQGKMFDEKKILSELNHCLREEVINATCLDLLEQVPLFSDADPYFVSSILTELEFEVFLIGDTIIAVGSKADKMYFISRGTVSIRSLKHNVPNLNLISDGGYFGERALLQPNSRRIADVIAETYCYLYSLSSTSFHTVLKNFPRQRTKINKIIQTRLKDHLLSESTGLSMPSNRPSTVSLFDEEMIEKHLTPSHASSK